MPVQAGTAKVPILPLRSSDPEGENRPPTADIEAELRIWKAKKQRSEQDPLVMSGATPGKALKEPNRTTH